MNHGLSFITPMAELGYAVFQANDCPLNVQQVIYLPVVMVLGTFAWASLEPMVVVEQTLNATEYLIIIGSLLLPCMEFLFSIGNGMFYQNNARIVLQWF